MSLADRVREANDLGGERFLPFAVAGRTVGRVRPTAAGILAEREDVFALREGVLRLSPGLDDPRAPADERTAAVDGVLRSLRDSDSGLVRGWRDEPYPVLRRWGEPPLMLVERAAVPLLGVPGYGVHVNGTVGSGSRTRMWIARRALDRPTWPGRLDQIVAGGQPAGLGIRENLVKECAEEAGIDAATAARAVPVGVVSYCRATPAGLRPDVLFCFDLALPEDFEPRCTDGEVEDFRLWPLERVRAEVSETRAFKFNCALVVIDYLVRHGHVGPEEPGFVEMAEGLRGPRP